MATLIDSSVLIAAERGDLDYNLLRAVFAAEDIAVSLITASELLHGVHRARTAPQRRRREAFVEAILDEMIVLPFDLPAARAHASIWADLAKRRTIVGERDLMIGAIAIANGYSVCTRDARSFPRIAGLTVILL
jgi:tRNA(fMet)-specific endonuclease VapC